MDSLGLGKITELVLNWGLRICVGVLTYFGVEMLGKINTASEQMLDLSGKLIQVSAQIEILRHDFNSVEKRMDRMEGSIEKIKEK